MRKISISLNGFEFSGMLVAENYPDMNLGLDGRESLDEREGFLYVFDKPRLVSFNNKNQNFTIDVVTVDGNGVILEIETIPSGGTWNPEKDFLYACEILGGLAERIGLEDGKQAGLPLAELERFRNAYKNGSAIVPMNLPLPDGWLDEAREELRRHDFERDDPFELNMAFAGAKFDLDRLRSQGWKDVEGEVHSAPYVRGKGNVGASGKAANEHEVWLEYECECDGTGFLFRLFCSNCGHFRYLYAMELTAQGGFSSSKVAVIPDALKKRMETMFRTSLLEPAAENVAEELERTTGHLSVSAIKEDSPLLYKRFLLWGYEFERHGGISRYYCNRFLNGMLRLGNICDYEDILADMLYKSFELDCLHGVVRLASIILKRTPESASLWNALGCAFDRIGMDEAALFCFVSASRRKYNEQYCRNIWILGERQLPVYMRKSDMTKVLLTADAMVGNVPADCENRKLSDAICAIGMVYESREEVRKALECYCSATAFFCVSMTNRARKADKKAPEYERSQLFHDNPLLFQAIFRMTMENREDRRRLLQLQMGSYPLVPDEVGVEGNVPVSYRETEGLGDLWDAVAPGLSSCEMEDIAKMIVEQGKPCGQIRKLPGYACGSVLLESSCGLSFGNREDEKYPLSLLGLLGKRQKAKDMIIVSILPAFRPGNGYRIESPILSLNLWNNAVEALAEFRLCEEHVLKCYIQDFGMRDYVLKTGKKYAIEIAVFGYGMSLLDKREISIEKGAMVAMEKRRLRQEGKDDNISSVKIGIPEDICSIFPSPSGCDCDVSILAKIESVEDFMFMENPCLRITLAFDERGGYAKIPVYMAKSSFGTDYLPKAGDTVQCCGWLQGIVLEEIGDCAREEEKADDEETLRTSFMKSVGTAQMLDEMAFSALKKRDDVKDLVCFPDALSSDPRCSCTIEGANVFVKVFTGYFESEEAGRKAIAEAYLGTPWKWHGSECRLAIVAGISSGEDKDGGYFIDYLGMAEDARWERNLYAHLGVNLDNLHEMNEDKVVRMDGRSFLVSQVWHHRYDFTGASIPLQDRKTRLEVVRKVLQAWKRHNASVFPDIISGDAFTYGSYWVKETMYGCSAYCNYIAQKFKAIAESGCELQISLVRLLEGIAPHGCVYALHMTQGDHSTLLTFEFDGEKISRMHMTEPEIYTFEYLGEESKQKAGE